jgi:hypothetical protein
MKKLVLSAIFLTLLCLSAACSGETGVLPTAAPGVPAADTTTAQTESPPSIATSESQAPSPALPEMTNPTLSPAGSPAQTAVPPSKVPDVSGLSPSEKYLTETSDEDIFNHFIKATYVGTGEIFGFTSPSEISSPHLFRFAVLSIGVDDTDMLELYNNWYSESDRIYHIPLSDIIYILDIYFDGYFFNPDEAYYADYNGEKDEFETTALGFGMGAGKPTLGDVAIIDNNTIDVIITDELVYNPQDGVNPAPDIVVRGKITDNGVKFLNCLFVSDAK